MTRYLAFLALAMTLAGCAGVASRQDPVFSPTHGTLEHRAMTRAPVPEQTARMATGSSLWRTGSASLLGDRRAQDQGDILTVVIEIDEGAEISNSTSRSRDGEQSFGVPSLLGIPQRLDTILPDGATTADALSVRSSSDTQGRGSVRRNEELTLRVAATVVTVLPNGILQIQGSQEVRVNDEIRELLVTGYVRPEDVSRQNEITYDKIASARISYGGRGYISAVQGPRYGQRIADGVLPF